MLQNGQNYTGARLAFEPMDWRPKALPLKGCEYSTPLEYNQDTFWASRIHPWDVAAGVLLVREAGGVVTARDGREFDLWNPHFVAAAGKELHRELLSVLSATGRGGCSGD